MADAASTRPRPRPRPRPTAKAKASTAADGASNPDGSAAGPSNAATPKKLAPLTDDDINAMFMKNKNRSLKTWHKLEELGKEDEKNSGSGSGSDSDGDESPRSRKRVRKDGVLPKAKWQSDANLLRMLSEPPDEDEPDFGEEVMSDTDKTPSKAKDKGKRKRNRSRSRSITPPPMIPQQTVENVKRFIQQAMGESSRARNEEAQHSRQHTPFASESARATPPLDEGDVITITVAWKPHPQDTKGCEMEWQYKINRGDSFHDLFEAIAEDARIRVENLVVCHAGKRIFASVSPRDLEIWVPEVEFTAYTNTAFDFIRRNPDHSSLHGLSSQQPQTQVPASANRGSGAVELSDSEDDRPPPASHGGYSQSQAAPQSQSQSQTQSHHGAGGAAATQSDAEDEDDDKFKIVLRSQLTGNKEITLTVRPTTKCGNILRAFLKKAGLESQYPEVFSDTPPAPPPKPKRGRGKAAAAPPATKDPRLCVDGDKLDNESPISEADLEDGDMVEVVGL